MKENKKLDYLMDLHRAFWSMENSEPLLNVEQYTPLRRDLKIPLSDGRLVSDNVTLYPDLIDPKLFVEKMEQYEKSSLIYGNFIETLAPYDLCWTQAFIGCPIRVSSGKTWAEPFLKDLTKIDFSSLNIDRKWFEKLLEFTEVLVKYSAGRYPVVHPLFRGPMDMAASALGSSKLCVAVYRHPEELRKLLDFCAQTFIDTLKAQLRLIPKFHDGYSCLYGICAPKPICRNQADYSVLISPKLYEKIFLPYDLKIINAFEHTVFHLHSATIHIARTLAKIPNLGAIEVSIDYPAKAFSPPVKELIPTFKEIQKNKPLIVSGAVKEKEMCLILNELSPKGLALKLYRVS